MENNCDKKMKNIKKGDVIEFIGDDLEKTLSIREVRGVCGEIVFVREVLTNGVGPTEFYEIEDLQTFGWKIK